MSVNFFIWSTTKQAISFINFSITKKLNNDVISDNLRSGSIEKRTIVGKQLIIILPLSSLIFRKCKGIGGRILLDTAMDYGLESGRDGGPLFLSIMSPTLVHKT